MANGCGSGGCLSEEVECGRRSGGGVDMNDDGWKKKNKKEEEWIEEKERE